MLLRTLRTFVRCIHSVEGVQSRVKPCEEFAPLVQYGYDGISRMQKFKPKSVSDGEKFESAKVTQLREIVEQFEGVDVTIGYGSGVFEQEGYQNKKAPQIDMVHIVQNSMDFHRTNLKRYPQHYSGLKYGGVGLIEYVQNIGAGLYYNPFVNMRNSVIKYGIILRQKALTDIVEWKHLYLAGRLHKPVRFVGTDEELQQINMYNLQSAVVVSIFIIDKLKFTRRHLYETIASLSYLGDPRMSIGGENPNKVKNIVSKQYDEFDKLYDPVLLQLKRRNIVHFSDKTDICIEWSAQDKQLLLSWMPQNFRHQLKLIASQNSTDKDLNQEIIRSLKNIVLRPLVIQSIKGLFTAGIHKSVFYIIQKRLKYLQK